MQSLENHLLIAMPSLTDSLFNKTVTYICDHNEQGAMGLIINLPVQFTLNELKSQVSERPFYHETLNKPVLVGGPVAPERGFVLHSIQNGWDSSIKLNDQIMITTSKDILMALGTEHSPERYLVTLGYAGWGPGQLEQEIKDNAWLTLPADEEILFETPVELRWQKAAEKLGIDWKKVSNQVGHA
jgi:putative transcriptional regulator